MRIRPHRVPGWALGLLLATAVAACGGTAAGVGGNPAGPGSAGDVEPGDHSQTLQAAFDAVVTAGSFTFEATVREYGTFAYEATMSGTTRTEPVEASLQTWTAQDGTKVVHLIHDGTLWLDGGDGSMANVGEVSDSIRDQQAPYDIAEIWGTLDFQLEHYEVVGEEQVGGAATTHYRLNDHRRAQAVDVLKVPVSQYSSDIWVDGDGVLRKVFRGVQADASGEPTKGSSTTWTLIELDCTCRVEPPAA